MEMKMLNRVEIRLDGFDKSCLVCDIDAPIGKLYDYSCALQSFLIKKMQEAHENQKNIQETPPENVSEKIESIS